jgi:hypothetical protein
MRDFPVLPVLVAALVAGCGPAEADLKANMAAGPPAAAKAGGPPAPPPPPVPPPATGKTIPAALLGTYDASIESCGRPGDGRLTVSVTELRFHESIGTVRRVTATGAGAVSVEADYQGEGERWRDRRELKLGDGGSILTVSGVGTSFVRVRCPEGTR